MPLENANIEISQFLQERIEAGDFPSAVYLIAEKGEIVQQDAVGSAVVEPERIAAEIDTIYDLASLTKVLVTGCFRRCMIENRTFDFESSVGSVLPAFQSDFLKARIKIRHLLTHTSGLRSWLPFYLHQNRKEPEQPKDTILRVLSQDPLEKSTGVFVNYSDLNFLALAALIETSAGPNYRLLQRKTSSSRWALVKLDSIPRLTI
jgi:CubicO group peptidase (beta-lactamase class C family)